MAMKQYITNEQVKELNEKESKKLIDWCLLHSPQNWQCRCPCKPPLLSIGDMIEFLDENIPEYNNMWYKTDHGSFGISDTFGQDCHYDELCDALWYAVKEVLRKLQGIQPS